jgi:hypothetical protein
MTWEVKGRLLLLFDSNLYIRCSNVETVYEKSKSDSRQNSTSIHWKNMLYLATLAILPTLELIRLGPRAYRRHPDPFDIQRSWQGRKKGFSDLTYRDMNQDASEERFISTPYEIGCCCH